MTREQKIAVAKVIRDMIKADSLIDESEIRDMQELLEFYNITSDHMASSKKIRFADAINTLKDLNDRERITLYDKISKIALSDGVCLSSEAMLLIALNACLLTKEEVARSRTEQKHSSDSFRTSLLNQDAIEPQIVSFPTSDASFTDKYIIYIENKFNSKVNEEIEKNHRLLTTLTQLYGFKFIYMPDVSEEFREMEPTYLKSVIEFISPNFKENDVERTYNRLCNLTTPKFYEEVITNRLKIDLCKNDVPFLILNVGTSTLQDDNGSVKFNTDFLCVPITNGIVKLIEEFSEYYEKIVSIKHTITVNGTRGRFKYFGFYKALFDFIIAPPPVLPDLIFYGQDIRDGRYKLCFRYPEDQCIFVKLTPNKYETFYAIANKTYNETAGGLHVSQAARPDISHIKSTIDEAVPNLTYPELYKPDRKGNLYVLNLSADKVFERISVGAEYKIVPLKK